MNDDNEDYQTRTFSFDVDMDISEQTMKKMKTGKC